MNQQEPTPEQIKKQLHEAIDELHRQPAPAVPLEEDEDEIPTHTIAENQPTPQEVIEEEHLGPESQ